MSDNPIKPQFWKLSQGVASSFTFEDMLYSIEKRLVFVHKDTPAKGQSSQTQGADFVNARIGDYFLPYPRK